MGKPAFNVASCGALAMDGDGTVLTHKKMAAPTTAALMRWRKSGRKLILVTGETVEQLDEFPHLDSFDLVVAENGAMLFWPTTKKHKLLTRSRPATLVGRLRREGISPLNVGKVIVSTHVPHDRTLRKVFAELRLEWEVILNRRNVMALPSGVDKSSGLCAGLEQLGLQSSAVIGIGDAENDVALLKCCGHGVAVSTAVPALLENANRVMPGGSGKGVVQLIDEVLAAG